MIIRNLSRILKSPSWKVQVKGHRKAGRYSVPLFTSKKKKKKNERLGKRVKSCFTEVDRNGKKLCAAKQDRDAISKMRRVVGVKETIENSSRERDAEDISTIMSGNPHLYICKAYSSRVQSSVGSDQSCNSVKACG